MLAGDDLTLIGGGKFRDVYLVEYEGRQLVVKTLRHVDELAKQKVHLSMHRREVLTLDAVSGVVLFTSGLGFPNIFIDRVLVLPELTNLDDSEGCWYRPRWMARRSVHETENTFLS